MLGDIAKGNDPKSGKRINTLNDITLREVLQKFLEIKPNRKDTQLNYHFAINRHFNGNRSWHRIYPRQGIIPDLKLKEWYRAVGTLQNEVARDFFFISTLNWYAIRRDEKAKIVPCRL